MYLLLSEKDSPFLEGLNTQLVLSDLCTMNPVFKLLSHGTLCSSAHCSRTRCLRCQTNGNILYHSTWGLPSWLHVSYHCYSVRPNFSLPHWCYLAISHWRKCSQLAECPRVSKFGYGCLFIDRTNHCTLQKSKTKSMKDFKSINKTNRIHRLESIMEHVKTIEK